MRCAELRDTAAAHLLELPDIVIDREARDAGCAGQAGVSELRGRYAIRDPRRIAGAAKAQSTAIFAFDLLQLGAKTSGLSQSKKRNALLKRTLKKARRICYCQHVGEVRERLCRGRTPNWIKIKTGHGRHVDAECANRNE